MLEKAFASLREEHVAAGKGKLFDLIKAFLLDRAGQRDYHAAAAILGMTPNAVALSVHRLRQRYRQLIRAEVAQTVSSPGEIEAEMRHLLSVLAR